ncbi:MAG TPA: MMPL family transporter [Nevskia sp.]|nr:MMPL family transporter [Nevskia sp.]
MHGEPLETSMPVVPDPAQFDRNSGNWLERLIFNHRLLILALCALLTAFFGWHASQLRANANFEKMIPRSHPYIRNYFDNKSALAALGNSVRIAVENTRGDVFDPEYLAVLQKVNDTAFLMPGVDRPWMKSLWAPVVRWTIVTEEGFRAGPVMPEDYDGSPEKLNQLRVNIGRAGLVGNLVANDLRSSMVFVPLQDRIAETGQPLDYAGFSQELEGKIRSLQTDKVRIHIIGFAKLVGDLIDGLHVVMGFFAVSVAIAAFFIFLYTRCLRSSLLLICISSLGVLWMLGIIQLLGYVLDPYSILVPFLIFAIGASHGAQKMNGIMQDVARGTHKYVAARYTFRRLFMAGLTALLTNIVGFAVLMVIDIPVIRDLALTTSIGVTVLIFTKLVMVPVALSYVGVSHSAAQRRLRLEESGGGVLARLLNAAVSFTDRRRAAAALGVSALIGVAAFVVSLQVKIGDLDPGAPELRPDSRYNLDNAFVTQHFGLSSDQFAVMVKTPQNGCETFETLVESDRLGQALREVPGVQAVTSASDLVRLVTAGAYEGNPKWLTINRNRQVTDPALAEILVDAPELTNSDCAVAPVIAYLQDHKADTLTRVVQAVQAFAAQHDKDDRKFLLAAGSAGIEAVTNMVVKQSNRTMLIYLYSAVILLCYVTFRSWRAVLVALIPLLITSTICEALMVLLGIGIKVATLPVIALGVGVGVDYALYLLSVQLAAQRAGLPLREAYARAVGFTGKVVALIGVTMAAGVVTWAWSPIKFQADMGILLAFMFLWNMVGALVLIPALSAFLLRSPATRAGAVPLH